MAPVQLLYEHDTFIVVHRCTACGHEKRNKTAADDDVDRMHD
jgi:hypothetical protein